ncbi:2-oxoglutarate-dependent ethylene/succinate-forming enzyme [Trichoderma gamsii]|uniref:2-oxoglutarate-dependent ethylene/succinate-forming enzyme n=1 Tax=Trichoderma gamsii TaxID=398673 RepID=A0A2P4ZNE5_9HYPO|nr:2-oxoglutarate-dependent ethylene/succinate-forming enzyme [Trichoderma gamsii]PON25774.1 2-oxoglutarate-dependent ethylene/succinate-forming enzyme [Trichoderma gamsii]
MASVKVANKGVGVARHLITKTRAASTSAVTAHAAATHSLPPGFTAKIGQLETFTLPEKVSGSVSDKAIADAMIGAWRRDGILQIGMSKAQQRLYQAANAASRRFFSRPRPQKQACVDDMSYSGYIASGEEITDGVADYSEIFTVTKDLPHTDQRVAQGWPCHGPCPWADQSMKNAMNSYMVDLAISGEKLLQLIEMGLDVPTGSLTRYTDDGWHHMRVLRFPHKDRTNGKGKKGRGIGSHTDYGLLVIAAQDEVGGLFVRPPHQDEQFANWEKTSAGLRENDAGWMYVPPAAGTFTVFPGDMMQYMTNNFLKSTPHKVGLNVRERFAFAYFHEPNFRSVIKPLPGYNAGQSPIGGIHYGTHFTNMFLRNYPDRVTTARLREEGRYHLLASEQLRDEDDVL